MFTSVAKRGCELGSVHSKAGSSHCTLGSFSGCSLTIAGSVKGACLDTGPTDLQLQHSQPVEMRSAGKRPTAGHLVRGNPDLTLGNKQLAASLSREGQRVLYP